MGRSVKRARSEKWVGEVGPRWHKIGRGVVKR